MNMKAQHGVHIGKYWDIRLASAVRVGNDLLRNGKLARDMSHG